MPTPQEFAAWVRGPGSSYQTLMQSVCVRVLAANDLETHFRPHGTASLFSIAGMHFLVTAAHLHEDGARLWVENNWTARRTRFQLIGERLVLPLHDVAVVRLREDVVAAFAGMRFLTMQDVLLGPSSSEYFMLAGFPQELNTNHQVAVAMIYFTRVYRGSTTGFDFNPKTQLLLEYDLSFGVGIDGSMAGMPDGLHGLSGSAIWRTDFHSAAQSDTSKVVGVQTSQIRLEPPSSLIVVKATRWDGVLLSLVRIYPNLEPVLKLYGVNVSW